MMIRVKYKALYTDEIWLLIDLYSLFLSHFMAVSTSLPSSYRPVDFTASGQQPRTAGPSEPGFLQTFDD
jgi:hypothetical protein